MTYLNSTLPSERAMPKISGPHSPVVPSTSGQSRAHQPAAPSSQPAAPTSWGNTPRADAAERREKATGVSTRKAELTPDQQSQVAQTKATCPFIASGVKSGALPVRNDADKPLASIDDVAKLGNTGKGSDLGELLKLFAQGNHGFMPGMSGKLDLPVPPGHFSLDFPGSQGSHAGHSGILQGDPTRTNTGRFSDADFERLASFAKDGHVSRSDLGKFIAHNVLNDPNANKPGLKTAGLLAKDFGALTVQVAKTLKDKAHGQSDPVEERKVTQQLTKLLAEDNLIGSAGEFGLMAALLANSPNTIQVGGLNKEPAYSMAELELMFKHKQFPAGWETWKKTTADWAVNTSALALAAEKEVLKSKFR
jgi:hypothetical protein